jgi:serine protease Do
MSQSAMQQTRPAPTCSSLIHRAGVGLLAASMMVWTGVAAAAPAPESFSGLAKKVTPSVVNIASTQEISNTGQDLPGSPVEFPGGSPCETVFRPFQDRRGEDGRPSRRRATPPALAPASSSTLPAMW